MTRALAPLLALATASSGCATLLASKTAVVPVNSNVQGAQVIVDGQPVGPAPTTLMLPHQRPHTIVVRAQGYQDITCQRQAEVGPIWVVLDVFCTGLIGLLVDAVTEDWKSIDSSMCYANFAVPAGGAAAPPPASGWDAPAGGEPVEGEAGGACYPNNTCNGNLVCDPQSGRCGPP